MGRGGRGSSRRGVEGGGRSESTGFRRWSAGRGAPRCSLFKRPAEAPRARPAPAAQTCRVGWRRLACGRGRGRGAERLRSPRPSCSGRSRPSRSLPSAPAWLSLPLAPSTARSLARSHFFLLPLPRRPHLGRLRQRSAPAPLASQPGALGRTALPGAASPVPSGSDPALRGGRSRAARRSPTRSLALAGAAAAARPPAPPRVVRDSRRLRARLGPQRQRRPPRPGFWAPREPASGCRLSAPPGRAGAPPTPPRGADLAGAR